jgi:hypothetical protein
MIKMQAALENLPQGQIKINRAMVELKKWYHAWRLCGKSKGANRASFLSLRMASSSVYYQKIYAEPNHSICP